ncbi:hypothetical protein [Niveispirillum fermenti]|uniref:hypothetical protein n=1 Tax=Niveispirillum fermenti TaxID=1233113 RepID=UPI003A89B222
MPGPLPSDRSDPDIAVPVRFAAPGDGQGGGGQGGQLLYLGLFILLLAFFILLNSVSHFHDEKVGAVIRSVDDAFSSQALLTGAPGDRQQSLREAARAVRDLGDLIRAELPLAKVEAGQEAGTLFIALPAAALFSGDGQSIRPDQQGLMDRIARVLEPRGSGVAVRAEILFAAPDDADTGPLVARAGSLARALTALGADAPSLSVGLEKGQRAGGMRLLFTIHGSGGQ